MLRSHEHELFMKLDTQRPKTLMFMYLRVRVCFRREIHPYGMANPIYYFCERKILFLHPNCNRILATRINILFTLTLTLAPMSDARIMYFRKAQHDHA